MMVNGQAKSKREIIIKSDGMGKQKHLGLRVLRLIATLHPNLVSKLHHDLWTATSTFDMTPPDTMNKKEGAIFTICVLVCVVSVLVEM